MRRVSAPSRDSAIPTAGLESCPRDRRTKGEAQLRPPGPRLPIGRLVAWGDATGEPIEPKYPVEDCSGPIWVRSRASAVLVVLALSAPRLAASASRSPS